MGGISFRFLLVCAKMLFSSSLLLSPTSSSRLKSESESVCLLRFRGGASFLRFCGGASSSDSESDEAFGIGFGRFFGSAGFGCFFGSAGFACFFFREPVGVLFIFRFFLGGALTSMSSTLTPFDCDFLTRFVVFTFGFRFFRFVLGFSYLVWHTS